MERRKVVRLLENGKSKSSEKGLFLLHLDLGHIDLVPWSVISLSSLPNQKEQ